MRGTSWLESSLPQARPGVCTCPGTKMLGAPVTGQPGRPQVPGLGSFLAGSERLFGRALRRKGKSPAPRTVSVPPRKGPRSRAHLSAGEATDWAAPRSVGSRLAAFVFGRRFSFHVSRGRGKIGSVPQPLPFKPCAH